MKILSWGANQYGQLAHQGWPISEQCVTPQPCDTTGLPDGIADNLKEICGGGGHTLLLDTQGRVWACGLNNKGQCGHEPQSSSSTMPGSLLRPWHQVEMKGAEKIVHVAAGWEHSLALTSEGCLLGWGSNSHGQLGVSCGAATYQPLEIQKEIHHMAAGLRHSAWVTKQHTMKIYGSLKHTSVNLEEYLKCHKVSCGQRHVLALISAEDGGEGQVWSVGDNRHGQLAVNHTGSTQQLTVAQMLSHLRFSQLNCGWSHAAAITGCGQIVCWGRSAYGQLGIAPSEENIAQPVMWPNMEGDQPARAVQLAVGSEHTLVLLDSGAVLSCGWNEHGNCGTGDLQDVHTPAMILQGAKLIGSGAAHCFAVVN